MPPPRGGGRGMTGRSSSGGGGGVDGMYVGGSSTAVVFSTVSRPWPAGRSGGVPRASSVTSAPTVGVVTVRNVPRGKGASAESSVARSRGSLARNQVAAPGPIAHRPPPQITGTAAVGDGRRARIVCVPGFWQGRRLDHGV